MTALYIPEDCIYDILKYLQNSHTTLFNCLLVNRFWCKTTVPLLYADPFHSDPFPPTESKYPSIISTLISCFSKEEILQLKNQLKLTNIDKFINIGDKIDINNKYKPLFEYPKYLENFNYRIISDVIFRWLELSESCYDERTMHKKLCESFVSTFYHSILCRAISIKHLSISLGSFKIWNVQVNLTKLISLDLHLSDLDVETEFLSNVANSCLNLRKLEIIALCTGSRTINEIICAIIQKQNNLKEITLSPYYSSFINDILLSLEFQKHSLIYIELNNIDFSNNISFKNFINLCSLKYLNFYNCSSTIPLDQCEILKYASFKLKRLEIINNGTGLSNNDITPLMIKYLGTSLQELILQDNLNISIIENISVYCLNLIELNINISDINLLMLPYFKNLKIRILNIINNYRDPWDFNYDDIVKNLASNLSTNVKEVSLHRNIKPSHIRGFLENCHCCLEIINLNCYIELEILETILNYIERSNNSLKVFSIWLEKIGGNRELLNQIKTKGVKVVGY